MIGSQRDYCGRQNPRIVPQIPIPCKYDDVVTPVITVYLIRLHLSRLERVRFSCWP